jgi:hypothetical protein
MRAFSHVLCVCFDMKKRSKFRRGNGARPPRQRRDIVRTLAAQGASGDYIAATIGIGKNCLRSEHALDLHAGRESRKAEREAADASAISKEEYFFLRAAQQSFESEWFDPKHGNTLFFGMDGRGARNIDDAFAYWKSQGGRYITAGLSGKFDPEKYAAFSKIVERYRQNSKEE